MIRIIIALALLSSGLSHSQAKLPTPQEMLGQALADYGTIAGTWHLNQHCSLLSPERAKELEDSVATITISLRSEIPNPNMLLQIQQSSKKVATTEPYSSCGEKAKKIILGGSAHAINWAKQIKRIQSQAKG